MSAAAAAPVREFFLAQQEAICAAFEREDGGGIFDRRELPGERGGLARPWVLSEGEVFEKAAVHFSHTQGQDMPKSATARRPELAGASFEAVSISLIVHPRNPHVPTVHANWRLFLAEKEGQEPIWWFGGGMDLTPYYPYLEDALHWHRSAAAACAAGGEDLYPRFKEQCDSYFYLPHRQETRGIGGVFFDDWNQPDFPSCFEMVRGLAGGFLGAYLPIVQRRKGTRFGEREREFQLYRRGRYVEFNLLYDRGTLFGLQAGGRVESILASLPPLVGWTYDWRPEEGSPEAALADYLRPRNWLGEPGNQGG